MGRIRIGVSGWNYDGWRGGFYPEQLPKQQELAYIGDQFDTVEVNGTFYGLQQPRTFRSWHESVPSGFTFAVKGSRFITHNKKLKDAAGPLANFFASGVLELDDKLGPILWQLSPRLRFDAARLDGFLGLLPHDTDAAVELAKRHDDRIEEVAFGCGDNHRIRHVVEVRHESWLCDETVSIVREHGTALAFSHSAAWPYTEEITAGFVYLRLHGPDDLYSGPYGDDALQRWARRVERWHRAGEPDDAARITDRDPPPRKTRDVYVYFDNDEGAHAPREASALGELVRP
jgi:uncharacterized protein YecE (DUF72 family)